MTGDNRDGSGWRVVAIVVVLAAVVATIWWMRRESAAPATPKPPTAVRDDPGPTRPQVRAEFAAEFEALHLPTASIAGKVRARRDGRPIAGAWVCAWSQSLEPGEKGEPPRCATSERDGHYRIAELPPLGYRVSASAAGFVPGQYQRGSFIDGVVQLRPNSERNDVDLTLEDGGVKIRGVVHDMSGGVVEGARVHLRNDHGQVSLDPYAMLAWGDAAPTEVRSGADGRFEAWLRPGAVKWSVRADGYAHAEGEGAAPTVAEPGVEVYLAPAAVLIGKVVDIQTRAPVAGIRVVADREALLNHQDAPTDSALSDDAGEFRIDGLMPGRYMPAARGPGQAGSAARSVLLGMGETSEPLEIEVRAMASVRAQVEVQGTREPCPSGFVAITDPQYPQDNMGLTIRPDGSVLIEALAPATYKITVLCEGFQALPSYPDLVVTAAGPMEGVVWQVRAGVSLAGTVRDDRGNPVAQAAIHAEPLISGSATLIIRSAGSDVGGAFTIPGIAPGEYAISAMARGLPSSNTVKVQVAAGSEPQAVDLVVRAGPQLRGRVRDGDGRAVVGAVVTAQEWSLGTYAAQTGADGGFTLSDMRPGQYAITAERTGYMLSDGGKSVAMLRRDVPESGGQPLALVLLRAGGEIRGKVRTADGGPVTDAFVLASHEDPAMGKAQFEFGKPVLTDLDGRFEIDGLEPGAYTVRAYRRGGGEAQREHVAVGSDVVLALPKDTSIGGEVTADGLPAQAFQIEARNTTLDTSRQEHFLSGGGTWEMHDLAPGSYLVIARSPQGRAQAAVELTDGDSLRGLTLALQGRVPVTGRLVELESQLPVVGAYVVAEAFDDGLEQLGMAAEVGLTLGTGDPRQTSDAAGRFTLPGVPPGPLFMAVLPKGFPEGDHWVAVTNHKATPGTPELGDIPIVRNAPKGALRSSLGFGWAADRKSPADPARVGEVVAGGPAARAGLKTGDVLTMFGDHVLTGFGRGHLAGILVQGGTGTVDKPPGTAVKLTLADERLLTVTTVALPGAPDAGPTPEAPPAQPVAEAPPAQPAPEAPPEG